jgi:hypothetical protein
VLEEDVHELPDDVVEGLAQLLVDERVVPRRLEPPLVAAEREAKRLEFDDRVVRLRDRVQLVAVEREGGQRALADDDRVDELDGDVMRVRPRLSRAADGEEAAAADEALR